MHPVHKTVRRRVPLVILIICSLSTVLIARISHIPELQSLDKRNDAALSFRTQQLHYGYLPILEQEDKQLTSARRQELIDKVEALFRSYRGGTVLAGYGHIFVDQAERCGGDYATLVGIAGAESGLGRAMYKKYNPFGFLNRKDYPNLKVALTELTCLISQRHLSRCGGKNVDLNCLHRVYGVEADRDTYTSRVESFRRRVL